MYRNPPTERFTGMTVEEARRILSEEGHTLRIVEEDGIRRTVTGNFKPGRVSAVVSRGRIVSATIEKKD